MGGIIVPIEMPHTCSECHFCSRIEEMMVGAGLYQKISRCLLSPDDVEDPWRNISWQAKYRETWCPLREMEDNDVLF